MDFNGFQKLFRQFLQGTGPSMQWEKIEPLPADAVSYAIFCLFGYLNKIKIFVVLVSIFF